MMDGNDIASETNRKGFISQAWTRLSQIYQGLLDKWTPHTKSRWVASFLLLVIFILRIFLKQGWYIVTYALGIYHLNLFIAFLTPKIDPAMDFDAEDENGPALPTRASEEFRPFIRRLPEFKFWLSVTKSTLIGFFCTFIDAFNIPVFWPILVMYFITLFCLTMKRQIKVSKIFDICISTFLL
ncbi:putative rer1 protein isoform 2 [Danaus plexippus plexippus]|uniref:Protein RER1 n=1 Tax=Danaus plexippus plexippus TaxID=278856 RepID=A0A212EJL2_DANPL|nr:putative rer1 protein isoform 2 [Danaus plexippus plexippus]